MTNLNLAAAIEAGAQTAYGKDRGQWVSGHGITAGGTPWGTSKEAALHESYSDYSEAIIRAALPHILTALVIQAATEASKNSTYGVFDTTPIQARRWLRAKAKEARG